MGCVPRTRWPRKKREQTNCEQQLRSCSLNRLLVLSATKFAIVVLFYMHLKFDLKILSWFFGASLLIAMVVIGALFTLFTYNRTLWWWSGKW